MTDKVFVREKIIELLIEKEQVTRPFLTEYLNMRPATLLEIVDSLKNDGLILEPERKGKKTGRRASPICLNKDYAYFLGIDFQVKYTACVAIDFQGNVVSKAFVESSGKKDIESGKREILDAVSEIKAQLGDKWKNIAGAGFADPGLVDIKKGVSLKAVNIPGWEDFDTGKWLSENYGADSVVYPANLARTFMECLERPDSAGSLFHLEVDAGIGAGFIKDGKLFIGDSFCGMELGHVVIDPSGPLCQCGNRGCLEAIAGEIGIRKKVLELSQNGVLTELLDGDFSLKKLVDCVNAGDKAACALAHDVCEKIGLGLAAIVALLNPSTIVVSGVLSGLGDLLVGAVKRMLALHCFPSALQVLEIEISSLGEYSTATGAALLMRKKVLENCH